MSKNRPKIWLDDNTYIYRCDYNMYIALQQQLGKTFQVDAIQSCRKFLLAYGDFRKNSFLEIMFNGYSNPYKFRITRIDADEYGEKPRLQLQHIKDGSFLTLSLENIDERIVDYKVVER